MKACNNYLLIVYLGCNSEQGQNIRARVWCTEKSGGVERNWVGVPRKFKDPTNPNGKMRCACVRLEDSENDTLYQMYESCPRDATSCFIGETKTI